MADAGSAASVVTFRMSLLQWARLPDKRRLEEMPVAQVHDSRTYRTLIVVAGHSVYLSHNFSDPYDNSNWYLLDYQVRFYIIILSALC